MAVTRIKTNQITDQAVTTAKIANKNVTGGKLEDNLTYGSNLTINGNLAVTGTTTTVDTTQTTVADPYLMLSSGASGAPSVDGGIIINRGTSDNATIFWDESADTFVFGLTADDGTTAGDITLSSAASITADLVGDVTGDLTGNLMSNDGSTVLFDHTSGAITGNITSTGTSTFATVDINGGAIDGTVIGANSAAAGTFTTINGSSATITGTITGGTLTDGTASITGGNGTGFGNITASGTVTGGTLTDSTLSINAGSITGGVGATFSGTVTGGTLTDSTLSINAGSITGGVAATFSGTVTANLFDGNVEGNLTGDVLAADGTLVLDSGTNGTDATFTGDVTGDTNGTHTGAVIGDVTGNVEGNLISNDGSTVLFDHTNGAIVGNVTSTGTSSFATASITTADINGGTIDGTAIGGTTAAAGAFTTLDASGQTTLAALDVNGNTTIGNITVDASSTLDMGANKVTNMADPTSAQDAATKAYVDNQLSTATNVDGDTGTDDFQPGDTIKFFGTTNEITTSVAVGASGPEVTIGLPTDVVITGNLTVQGTTVTVDATTTTVEDPVFRIGTSGLSAEDGKDRGIEFMHHDGTSGYTGFFGYDDSAGEFVFIPDATNTSEVFSGSLGAGAFGSMRVEDLTANYLVMSGTDGELQDGPAWNGTSITADLNGDVNGDVSSSGTSTFATVDINGGNIDGTVIGATTTAAASFTTVSASGLITASGGVSGDVTGNLTGNVMSNDGSTVILDHTTGELTGNADTADAWSSARTITLGGDLNGSVSIDGSANVTFNAYVNPDSVALGTDTTGNYVQQIADAGNGFFSITNGVAEGGSATIDLVAGSITLGTITDGDYVESITGGAGIASTGATTGEGIAHTLSVDLTDTNVFNSDGTVSTAVVLDASGDFTANMITADLTGNVTSTGTSTFSGTADFTGATLTLDNDAISGDKVHSGTISDFASTGIDDNATSTQVTISDTSVDAAARLTAATGIIGSTTATAGATLKVDATDSMMIPVGTQAQRPGTAVTGMFRFNSTTGAMEIYDGAQWNSGADFTVITSESFTADGSSTAFTLTGANRLEAVDGNTMVMVNGVVQQPTVTYTVGSGNGVVTFDETPVAGDVIDIRVFTTTSTVTQLVSTDTNEGVILNSANVVVKAGGVDTLTVTGSGVDISGNLSVTGTLQLGDNAATDTVTVQATFDGNIVPTNDSTSDLGSTTNRYAEAHIDDIFLGPQGDVRYYDADASNYVAFQAPATVSSDVTWTLPSADAAVSGYALISDGAGTLSWAAAGATTTADSATNAERQIYFGSITTGAVTALNHDSGLTYNPSTGSLTADKFIGEASSVAANSVALGTDTTGNYVAAGATLGNGLSGSVSSEGGTFTVMSNATSSNQASTIVFRDGSGNFSAGTMTATATTAQYADLAEKYASDADYEPGTVVHFGGDAEVTMCDTDHCRKVAGVVSANPAYLMNSDADGVAVALQGRVPCKVTGPVKKGDMMVSAGNGMARAEADPKMGAVIGKALADHEGGEGVIEVVVGRM